MYSGEKMVISKCLFLALTLIIGSTALADASSTDPSGSGLRLTIVYDNYCYDPSLRTGWGFSCVVELNGTAILFDTGGDPDLLLENLAELDVNISKIKIVVLSHIHGDHVDGLPGILEINPDVEVYVPASFLASFKAEIEAYGSEVIEVENATTILPNVMTTGEFSTGSCARTIEQSLIVKTIKGVIVITGCAHPGIVDIVKETRELVDDQIYLVIGGFHLVQYTENGVAYVVDQLRDLGVVKAGPCHCSGDLARNIFADSFGDNYVETGVGKIIEIRICTDLNDDGVADTDDLLIMANAFKSHPGHERWNLLADMDNNDFINIIDIAKAAIEYAS